MAVQESCLPDFFCKIQFAISSFMNEHKFVLSCTSSAKARNKLRFGLCGRQCRLPSIMQILPSSFYQWNILQTIVVLFVDNSRFGDRDPRLPRAPSGSWPWKELQLAQEESAQQQSFSKSMDPPNLLVRLDKDGRVYYDTASEDIDVGTSGRVRALFRVPRLHTERYF